MDNGIYVALSRQLGLFRDMDMTANNIANVNTQGYQAEKLMFDDYLEPAGNAEKKISFVNDIASYHDTQQGTLTVTGNPLDIAISGKGYFTVQTALGERYTRAGNLQVDSSGALVTPDGYPVLDTGGQPIVFEPEDKDIVIGEAGNIKVNGEERATIGVVEFANPQMLDRVGKTMFKADGAQAQPASEARVLQGVIEGSNVQPVVELTRMIQVNRAVAGTAKLIETQYDLTRRTADTWARRA